MENADLNTTRYLERYLQGTVDLNQVAQTVTQVFQQEALETADTLADEQAAFEESVNEVTEKLQTSSSLKAFEQRLQELQHQAALLKSMQQEQQREIAKNNAQLQKQRQLWTQNQAELQQLAVRAEMPRVSPYYNTVTDIQATLTAYLRDAHDP